MRYTENSLNILTVKSYKGIGNAWIVKNLKGNENIEVLVKLLNQKLSIEISVQDFINQRSIFESRLIKKLDEFCDGFVALGDPNFPHVRGTVKESERPVFLFYRGNIDLLSQHNKNITVIGLLNPEGDIESREREVVDRLVQHGATIVSGLAFGCDSIAHFQALESQGKTIAILPGPLNSILPKRNKPLADRIVNDGGLLISEYGTEFKSQMELSSRYKERDRLQALYCDLIVLAASYAQDTAQRRNMVGMKLDSGARLAMNFAKEYKIPRAVMYNKADEENPMFDLNRDILTDDKSVIVINKDRLEEAMQNIITKISRSSVRLETNELF